MGVLTYPNVVFKRRVSIADWIVSIVDNIFCVCKISFCVHMSLCRGKYFHALICMHNATIIISCRDDILAKTNCQRTGINIFPMQWYLRHVEIYTFLMELNAELLSSINKDDCKFHRDGFLFHYIFWCILTTREEMILKLFLHLIFHIFTGI